MAANTKPEAYVLIPGSYNQPFAIPARLASQILPELIQVEERYSSEINDYEYKVLDSTIRFKLLDANKMTAIKVAARLEK